MCTVSLAHAPETKQNKTLFDIYNFFLNVLVPGFLSVVYAADGGAELRRTVTFQSGLALRLKHMSFPPSFQKDVNVKFWVGSETRKTNFKNP